MITIDLICESCGTSNPPGTEFCLNCNTYLAWDRAAGGKPTSSASATPAPTPQPTPPPDPGYGPDLPTQPQQPVTDPWAGQASPQGYPTPQGYPDASTQQGYPDAGYQQGYTADYQGGYDPQTYPAQGYDAQATQGYEAYDPDGDGYPDFACPNCGEINEGTRRFCVRCGYAFYSSEPAQAYSSGWSATDLAAHDREARKAYRRSLPPLYRWRRVLITLLVIAIVATLAIVLRKDPVRVVKDAWYGITKTYVAVGDVQASVEPADAVRPPSIPANVVDGAINELTLRWEPTQESLCDAAPGTATIVLRFPATRIRQLRVSPGLDQSNPQRPQQPLPKLLGVRFDGGECIPVPLTNAATQPVIDLDSEQPVSEMRIGIASAYPATADPQPFISITEIVLRAFPS